MYIPLARNQTLGLCSGLP